MKLLVLPDSGLQEEGQTVDVDGCRWHLAEFGDESRGATPPEFICVSYSWGRGRVSHLLDASRTMSDRTMTALRTAVRSCSPKAIWMDAFCVPPEDPERSACLREMGRIYARATQVVVVLSNAGTKLLEEIRGKGPVSFDALIGFSRDGWVGRAWTYQEMANAQAVSFVSEEGHSLVAAAELLNATGQAIARFRSANRLSIFEFGARHAALDSLESLIGEWRIGEYQARSAYEVIGDMDRREAERVEDYFDAMMGAISPPADPTPAAELSARADHFMRACEQKGDFSFIYTIGPRSDTPGRRWRPAPLGQLRVVLPWPSQGDGQPGVLHVTHLQLDAMAVVATGSIRSGARDVIDRMLAQWDPENPLGHPAARFHRLLRLIGFSGEQDWLETEHGYFFPVGSQLSSNGLGLAVSTAIRTTFGAPGLVLRKTNDGLHSLCGVGFFVGTSLGDGGSVNLA